MPRRRPVSIKGELEETDTEFLLHIRVVSSAKAHQGLRFTLSTPKEGIEDDVAIRDVVYQFLISAYGTDRAQEIIQAHPLRYWRRFITDDVLDTQKVRDAYEKDIPDQGMEASTRGQRPEAGFTKGRVPRS